MPNNHWNVLRDQLPTKIPIELKEDNSNAMQQLCEDLLVAKGDQ